MLDYIIVGQGLCGSVLALQLLEKGQKIKVIDNGHKSSSSLIAAGLFNPVNYRVWRTTWLEDKLFPEAKSFFTRQEKMLEASFYHPIPLLKKIANEEVFTQFMSHKDNDEIKDFVAVANKNEADKFGFSYAIWVKGGGRLDLPIFVKSTGVFLKAQDAILQEEFDYDSIELTETGVSYKGLQAKGIIFCEGSKAVNNPYFKFLPFTPTKGEVLTLKITNQKVDSILNYGKFLMPVGNDLYKTGSNYDRNYQNLDPTEEQKNVMLAAVEKHHLTVDKLVEHATGERPTVLDRRPYLGHHPEHKQVFIFNGMGSKGVSLAPFFGNHFCDYLLNKTPLDSECDIKRTFKKHYYGV